MSKIFVSVAVSLDGYLAPPNAPETLMGERWMKLQAWVFPTAAFRKLLGLGEGGETGVDNDHVQATLDRNGATIIGKRMFDAGEAMWPENAPFHHPVFVVTHQRREPWVRPGGTTFYFVNDGIEAALTRAREAAGPRDVRIGGGADVIQQYLAAGLVEELHLAISPVIFGGGTRLLDNLGDAGIDLELIESVASPRTTHVRYRILPR